MKLKYRKLLNKAIIIGVLIIFIVIFSLLKLNENVSEYFFARGTSRAFVFLMGNISDVFGFSVFALFVVCAIIALLVCIGVFIYYLKKKRRTHAVALLERVVITALSIALIYIGTAGGCYNRSEMPLPKYEGEQLSAEKTAEIVGAYIFDFRAVSNQLEYTAEGKSISPYSFDELAQLMKKEYARLDDKYFSSYTPNAKKTVFSPFMSYQGITGITFQPLGEAVINYETPNCYLVLTMAHELAHTKGVMRERDANLLAYYLLITSKVPYFRYCGYMYSLNYLTNILATLDRDLYDIAMRVYPTKARKDLSLENAFWIGKDGIINRISGFFNDLYLKLSGVKEGTGSYSDPSEIIQDTDIIDNKPVTVIKVNYSDTAKMLIAVALQ